MNVAPEAVTLARSSPAAMDSTSKSTGTHTSSGGAGMPSASRRERFHACVAG